MGSRNRDLSNLAGPRGIEPLLGVLETPGLPLTYGPISGQVPAGRLLLYHLATPLDTSIIAE